MSLPKIELHPAAAWVCDNCGNEHFVRMIERPEKKRDDLICLQFPSRLKCDICKAEFEPEFTEAEPTDEDQA